MLGVLSVIFLMGGAMQPSASAADRRTAAPTVGGGDPERLNVEGIKQKYWAQGDDTQMSVVQNRTYSKAGKIALGVNIGNFNVDPFLNVKSVGGFVGFHFNEYLGVNLIGAKYFSSFSSAYDAFVVAASVGSNYNKPQHFLGAEAEWSLLYGKLSLLGKMILYFDLHFLGGAGFTKTENGTYLTPWLGVGQQVYINQTTALRFDYRLMYYRETILQRNRDVINNKNPGDFIKTRGAYSDSIQVGIQFLLGV